MRKKIFLIIVVALVTCFASFYVYEARANAETDIRTVTVKVVADEEFRDFWGPKYNWKDHAKEIVQRASKVFEDNFGIRFVVQGFKEWNSDDHLWADANGLMGIDALVAELKREIRPGDEDIVVAFTGQGNSTEADGAVNDIFGRYILVEDHLASYGWWKKIYEKKLPQIKYNYKSWQTRVMEIAQSLTYDYYFSMSVILVHEFGHIFGARHTQEKSVMKWGCMTTRFDNKSKETILTNKFRDFKLIEELRRKGRKAKKDALEYIFKISRAENEGKSAEDIQRLWIEAAEICVKGILSYVKAGSLEDMAEARYLWKQATFLIFLRESK